MQINSGYGDAKEERLQRILVDFKFTDYSHETLESVTVNLKDLFEEYGYIPKAKAIPIEWIKKYIEQLDIKAKEAQKYLLSQANQTSAYHLYEIGLIGMLEDWEKENE